MEKFRHMRLAENQVSDDEAVKMLTEASNGVLALQSEKGYPVTIPVNFVYKDGRIVFHGAREGQKYELIQEEPMASFCVVAKDDIRPDLITSLFASTVVFGKVREIKEDEGRKAILIDILEKYMPEAMESGIKYMNATFDDVACFELEIENMTGKIGTP